MHLTRDDFDIITENGKHLNSRGEFNNIQFQEMMKGELWRYSRRLLSNELLVSDDEHFRSTILMLKLMENHISMSEDREEWLLKKIYTAVGSPDVTNRRSGRTGQKAEIGNSFSSSTPVDDVKDLILELTKQVSNQVMTVGDVLCIGLPAFCRHPPLAGPHTMQMQHSALQCCAPFLECIEHSVHSKSLALKCTRHSVHSTQWTLSTQCHSPYRHSVLSASIVCGPMCP